MPSRYAAQVAQLRRLVEPSGILLRPADPDDLAYLASIGVPGTIIAFFRAAEPSEGIDLAGARLWPIAELRAENSDAIPGYVIAPLGYPVIGTTVNGDVYCLDLPGAVDPADPPVLLASHDEIEEGMTPDEAREAMVRAASSFRDFLDRLVSGRLPVSYYDIGTADLDL